MRRFDNGTTAQDHRNAAELLPWYVNGTLEGAELERLTRHLEACDGCSAELDQQRRLAHLLRTSEELAFSPQRAFKELRDRLDHEVEADDPSPRFGDAFRSLAGPVRWALAAQLVAIVALGAALIGGPGERGGFRTLSTPLAVGASEAARFRIVFDATASEGDIRALLVGSGSRIVAGPSPFGVYTLEVATDSGDGVLDVLRSSSLVTFVEPAAGDPTPQP